MASTYSYWVALGGVVLSAVLAIASVAQTVVYSVSLNESRRMRTEIEEVEEASEQLVFRNLGVLNQLLPIAEKVSGSDTGRQAETAESISRFTAIARQSIDDGNALLDQADARRNVLDAQFEMMESTSKEASTATIGWSVLCLLLGVIADLIRPAARRRDLQAAEQSELPPIRPRPLSVYLAKFCRPRMRAWLVRDASDIEHEARGHLDDGYPWWLVQAIAQTNALWAVLAYFFTTLTLGATTLAIFTALVGALSKLFLQ